MHFREIEDKNNNSWIGVPIFDSKNRCIGVIRCTGKLRQFEGKCYNYIFDTFDLFIKKHVARIITPIFETIKSISDLNNLNKKLEMAERIREHEIRAPLAAITANADFVLRYLNEKAATSKPRRLREITFDAEICSFLLKEVRIPPSDIFISSLSYIPPGKLIFDLVKFLERQILRLSKIKSKPKKESFEYDFEILPFMTINFSGSASHSAINKYLMKRALYNLGINAIKYGRPNGTLNIEITEDSQGENIYINFIDDGIGIDEEDLSVIFIEGGRGRVARENYSGEGLGLSIAKSIIEAHGGAIRIISRRDPTNFRIELPIIKLPNKNQNLSDHTNIIRMDPPIINISKKG